MVLIGMPGVGKSTVGVILAKVMLRGFIDTDVYIQTREGKSLQQIIDEEGLDAFCKIEESHIISINCRETIIATGGSAVYSEPAMSHLKKSGILIHLYLPLKSIEKRLSNFGNRGVVMKSGQTLGELFNERLPLYRHYADFAIDCSGKDHDDVVCEILSKLKGYASRILC
ncbi:shikimate kinase [bacterium]|nr:shikimate kinase [bacterium]